ncbi:MAG: lamin tail domain-containing protein [Verrucomicrobiae bacterium]|nr:lamin tail domain-containing protein [Verrucomicrobiae bacterium]
MSMMPKLAALGMALVILNLVVRAPAQVVISEFMASNGSTLADEDGDYPDWIELHNAGAEAVNLGGWALTDSAGNPTKWRFPSVELAPRAFLVVFASGKNRTQAGGPLHTSFSLDASGEYLALVGPDGVTVASSFAPAFPEQFRDISYGIGQQATIHRLLAAPAPGRLRWPASDILDADTAWTEPDFNDASWTAVTTGIGYETETPGFAVRNVKASILVNSVADADRVLADPALQVGVVQENAPVLNYFNTGGEGRYENNRPFPGQSIGVDVDDFVIEATGVVTLPSAGPWTFGVNSDDGFRLTLGTFEMSFPNPRGPADTLGTFQVPAPGDYPLRLVYFERGGGAGLELFAAPGTRAAWSAGVFRLVGDTGQGGLAVRSTPVTGGGDGSFRSLIATDLESAMRDRHTSVYLRVPFTVSQPEELESLILRIQYNDGFIAYLNGHEVARRNAPAPAGAPATAPAARPPGLGMIPEDIPLSAHLSRLRAGANVLALQGFNHTRDDPRFLLRLVLDDERIATSSPFYFSNPTPGSANGEGFLGFAARPRFSTGRGFHDAAFDLEILSGTPGAAIYYTTNGTPPSPDNGRLYSGPLRISGTTVVSAAAFRDQYQPSPVETHTYIFVGDVIRQSADGAPPPGWPSSWGANVVDYGMDPRVVDNPIYAATIQDDLKSLPSFSVVMDLNDLFDRSTGIYANPGQDGRAWERPCSIELLHPDGTPGFQTGAGIRIRGGFSRSTSNPKHAFRLFFRQEYGAGKLNYPLFGDEGADSFDKIDLRTFQNYSWSFQGDSRGVFVRDQFNRDLQLAMGHQGERGEFYHLYINGHYFGLFNTCERPEASFGATYYGGRREDYDTIKVEAGPYTLNATDGDMEAWTRLYNLARAGFASDAAYQFVQGNHPDGTPNPQYEVLLDVPNLIDYMLIILYGGNLDAPISNFLGNTRPNNWYGLRNRTARDGFRFFVHDAEHTLLDVNASRIGPYSAGSTSVIYSNPQYLWQRLQANPEFRLQVADHVHRHFFNDGVLTPGRTRELFTRRTEQIDRAVVGESARWGDAKRSTPYTRATWVSAVNQIVNNFLPQRSGVVLSQLRSAGLYPNVTAPSFAPHGGHLDPDTEVAITAPSGVIHYTLDGSDPRLPGGGVSPSARAYSGPIRLAESARLRSRVLSGATWSALNEADYTLIRTFTDLWITELMYHPPDTASHAGTDLEFIELKNVGPNELDLGGVHFTSGIRYTFPTGFQIGPGQFVVLVSHAEAFASRYPEVPIDGVYEGQLDNAGERVTLAHAVGTPIFSVRYRPTEPWPLSAAGGGFSLVPRDPNLNPDPDDPANWRASQSPGGSPGRDDAPIAIPPILVNELLAHTDPPMLDAVELHNPTASPVDIGHWYLTDRRTQPRKYRIPAPTVIEAGGYVVFDETHFNAVPGAPESFSFSSHGEEVYLFSGDAAGNLTGYSHGFSFPASANGVSFGRHVTSIQETHYPPMAGLSLGSANPGPRVGPVVISEIHSLPSPGQAAFVELKNVTDSPVPLHHPEHPDIPWRINGIGFRFPPGLVLPPGGLVVVTSGDPEVFRSRFGVPGEVPVLGPFPGTLQSDGERLQLLRPDHPDVDDSGSLLIPEIVVDQVRYRTRAPWPVAAAGVSLERLDALAYGDDPANWRSSPGGPSPGLPNLGNRPPQVSVADVPPVQSAMFPVAVTLRGTVTDDGMPVPPGATTVGWSQIAGPAPAWFDHSQAIETDVHLPGVGLYVFRLSAHDGALEAGAEVMVSVDRPAAARVVVAQGSVWHYWDRGTDLPGGWMEPAFDHAAWPSGPAKLGYGDGDEATVVSFGPNAANKYPTTFFRKRFPVTQASAFTALKVGLRRDDGGIVYLNGVEVFRSNMPEGDIGWNTFATEVVGGADETAFYEQAVDPALLVEGENVLAVRIHQVNAGSSDLSFDLYLTGNAFPADTPPVVQAGPDQTVVWPAHAILRGSVRDDGLPIPPGVVNLTWSAVEGPGTVTFSQAHQPRTTAAFVSPGTYILRLTATDGASSVSDDLVITVEGELQGYEAWLSTYFTPSERLDPNVSGEDADPDLDGHTNRQEFLAGTHPRDPASVLRLREPEVRVAPVPAVILRFPVVAGRAYSVQLRDLQGEGVWMTAVQVPTQAADNEHSVTLPLPDGGPGRLYRVVTPPLP